jgi:hypothetical protein
VLLGLLLADPLSSEGRLTSVDNEERARNTFLQKLRKKWNLLWSKEVNSNIKPDRVALQTYPLILVEHNGMVCATITGGIPSFSDALEYWVTLALLYSPNRSSNR